MRPADDQDNPQKRSADAAEVCRVCKRELERDAPHAPFCSDRCRMADLGKWLSGDYRISRELKDADLEAGE